MKYLLLLLVIGLLVSPLLAAWPRPQQRQRERLRLQSMAAGIRVELSDAPGTERRTPNVAGPQGAWYCADLDPPVARRVLSWRSEDDGWHCQYCEGLEQAELLGLLDSLPAAVKALEYREPQSQTVVAGARQ